MKVHFIGYILNRPFSLKATKKTQKVNLQTVKIDGKKVRLTTKEIRSLEK